ncbi:MAG: hypothetical protein ACE5FA_12475, partial [Dehalococcoidia bacterium]
FREELGKLKDVLSDYDLTSLQGLTTLLTDLAITFGLLDESQIDKIMFKLKVPELDAEQLMMLGSGLDEVGDPERTQRIENLRDALGGISDKLERGANFIDEWTAAFDAWFGMIERRQGVIGTMIKLFETGATFLGRAPQAQPGAPETPEQAAQRRGGYADKIAGAIAAVFGVRFLGPILKGIKDVLGGGAEVGAGVANVEAEVARALAPFAPAAAAGGPTALIPGVGLAVGAWMAAGTDFVKNAIKAMNEGLDPIFKPLEDGLQNLVDKLTDTDTQMDRLNSTFNNFPSAVSRAISGGGGGGGGRPYQIRHAGGYIDTLQNEFVASPLTTRLLEAVVGGALTQRSLRQLAFAQAMPGRIEVAPGGPFTLSGNITLQGDGFSTGLLSKDQLEQLRWDISGFAFKKLREAFEA